jgi:hypothetical protein
MRAAIYLLLLAVPAFADICAPQDVQAVYGFQLSGTSTISGRPVPVASTGRLAFDAAGKVSGYSSVNFNGLFLGNPVTGTYQIQTDCSMSWKLQDDSGGWQSFAGKARPGGGQVEFHQSDPGSGARGNMLKVAPACTAAAFSGTYDMVITGEATPLSRDRVNTADSANSRVLADGAGGLMLVWPNTQTSGTYQVDGDCVVELEFSPPAGDPVKLRGVLVDSGNQVLAVHTDPQVVGTARLHR